jgi:hypothetical protein
MIKMDLVTLWAIKKHIWSPRPEVGSDAEEVNKLKPVQNISLSSKRSLSKIANDIRGSML